MSWSHLLILLVSSTSLIPVITFNFNYRRQFKGIPMFQEPAFRRLPPILLGAARSSWYQGSVFFAMMGELVSVSFVNWSYAFD